MEKKSKKSIIIGISVLLLITLTLLGLTYAYYRTRVIENPNNESISVTSKSLELTYADGTANIQASGVAPEDNFSKTKEFTVTNTGSDVLNDYVVALVDVVNTFERLEDWNYVLTCSGEDKNGIASECAGSKGNLPSGDQILATNDIEVGTTHKYALTITYANLEDVDQSIDMGKTLSGRINVRDRDSENPFISNKNSLAYNLVANAMIGLNGTEYRETPLTSPGKETTYLAKKLTELDKFIDNFGMTNRLNKYFTYASDYSVDSNTGKFSLDSNTVNYIKLSEGYETLKGKYIVSYDGSDNAQIANYTNLDSIYYVDGSTSEQYLRIKYITVNHDSHEATLSKTEDDYGDSYYFRGNVENNYVNFGGKCWRIVRIEGNGAIKLALADKDNECSSDINENDSAYIGNAHYGYDIDSNLNASIANYVSGTSNPDKSMRTLLNNWYNNNLSHVSSQIQQETDWCFGNITDIYAHKSPYDKFNQSKEELILSDTRYYYIKRLTLDPEKGEVTPSLLCTKDGGTKDVNKIGTFTADEYLFAGSTHIEFANNKSYFLYKNATGSFHSKTLTQVGLYVNNGKKYDGAFTNLGSGISTNTVTAENPIRPVISLIPGIEISQGNGTLSNPYTVKAN